MPGPRPKPSSNSSPPSLRTSNNRKPGNSSRRELPEMWACGNLSSQPYGEATLNAWTMFSTESSKPWITKWESSGKRLRVRQSRFLRVKDKSPLSNRLCLTLSPNRALMRDQLRSLEVASLRKRLTQWESRMEWEFLTMLRWSLLALRHPSPYLSRTQI
jgi:hypothetical protein